MSRSVVISDFPTQVEHPGRLIAFEALANLSALLLYPFGFRSSNRRTARAKDQKTIVFVHGYLSNPSCFLPLAGYLRARGHSRTLAYRYPAHIGIEQAAIGLRDYLKSHVRGGRIDLVCHSLGGLVARVYLQNLGGTRRVDSCVTLGTPHRGTYSAYWLWSRVGRELRPDSDVIARIRSTASRAKSVRFLSVTAGSDNIVLPRVFAKCENDTFYVPKLGHMGLLFSPQVFHKIHSFLRTP